MRACEICASTRLGRCFPRAHERLERCRGCGLERLEPQPSDEVLAAIYGAHYFDSWGLAADAQQVARLKRRTFAALLSRLAPPAAGARLLDCGAATGFLLDVARERGWEPYAIELSEFGAAAIAQRFGAGRVHCGPLESAQFADAGPGDFAVVTMCDLLEHTRDPRRTLSRARELLVPDGQLVITTPDTGSLSRALQGSGWSHYRPEHLYYFDRRNLTQLLRQVGFASIEFHPLWKWLSLDYVGHQLDGNPRRWLTPLSRGLRRLLPAPLTALGLPTRIGELFAIARA